MKAGATGSPDAPPATVVLVVATPPAAVVVVVVGNVVVVDVDVVVVVAFGSTITASNCAAIAVPVGPDTTVLRQKV